MACQAGVERRADAPKVVKLDTVRQAGQVTLLQYPGRVKADKEVNLAFKVSGTIDRFLAPEGAHVSKGDLLVRLDDTDYRTQLSATEAEYRQVKGDAERIIALYRDSSTTASNYDKAVYGLQQMEAKLKHHRDQLKYTELRAPFTGSVQKHLFDAHETVGAGMPVISLVGSGLPEVEISLPAAEYIRRERFLSFHCTFDLYPGRTYPLTLVSLAPKANANQLYTMRLRFTSADAPLPSPGMNTTVTIHCSEQEEVLLSVPTGALLKQDGADKIYLYSPTQQTVSTQTVRIVRPLSNGRMLITSPALKPGNVVVAAGVHHLTEGERVKPLPPTSETNVGELL